MANTNSQAVGDYVTDVRMRPFIQAQQVDFVIYGLRPLARVYAYFDQQDINTHVYPGTVINESLPIDKTNISVNRATNVLTVDAAGRLVGMFDLPASTFIVGERELLVADVDQLASLVSATTHATAQFNAYNFSVTTATEPATRPPVVSNPPSVPVISNLNGALQLLNLGWVDPLAETFFVDPQLCDNRIGCYLTKVGLFFKKKHASLGVTVELRTTDNGYPTKTALPFSQIHLNPSQISISDVAANETIFTFPSPVYVRAGQEYAVVVIPDANNPDYDLFVAEIGGVDLLQPTVSVTQDWGIGSLFMSHNNSTWTALQNEDLKFNLYRADFSTSGGTLNLTNDDYEFMTLANIVGTFQPNEHVLQSNGVNGVGLVNYTAGTTVITGNTSFPTSFLTEFSVGSRITTKVGGDYETYEITSISNNSYLTVKDAILTTNSAASYIATPTARVVSFDVASGTIVLNKSKAANSTFLFTPGAANNTIRGATSNALATIVSVDNAVMNRLQPILYRTTPQDTSAVLTGLPTANDYSSSDTKSLAFNDSNFFDIEEVVVASKSNEIAHMSGAKSLKLTVDLDTNTPLLSPTIDKGTHAAVVYQNIVNNSDTSEWSSNGNAASRYVSIPVDLADGQESEDIRVYLTAYRPAGTDVEVYVKLLNDADSDPLSAKYWTKMAATRTDLSDTSNRNSYVEIEYHLPDQPTTTVLDGLVSVSNTSANVGGSGTLFDSELAVGDVVMITSGLNFFITSVASKSSNTAAVFNANGGFTATGATIAKLTEPHTAWKDPTNDNIVTYINNDGAEFSDFKTFVLKVVLLSGSTNVVPIVRDLRAVAMTI